MTNKPMLSVERELLERILDSIGFGEREELKAILKRPAVAGANADGLVPDDLVALLRADLRQEVEAARLSLAAQHQGQPVAEVEVVEGDSPHVHLYQDVRDGTKLYAEQPAPAIKLHCNVSNVRITVNEDGSYTIDPDEQPAQVAADNSALLGILLSEITVDDRGFYHLSGIHPGNFKRALEESGAKITSEVKSHKSPVAVVMPERMDPRDPYDSEANQWNACLDEVARLNGVKP